MKTLKTTKTILLVIFASALIVAEAGAQYKSNLEILEIEAEPIRQGRNIVRAKIRNTSSEDQAFSIDIRTEGSTGNWQTQFPHVIAGSETKWIRQAYKIGGPIVEDLRIRLRFYAAGDGTGANKQKNRYFKEVAYSANDLEHAGADESKLEPASESQRAAIAEALRKFQDCVRNKEYEAAWQFFSRDLRDAELFGKLRTFQRCMETPYWMFPLSRAEVLALEPKSAGRRKDILALTTALEDERWMVNFVKVADKWSIDSFERIDAAPGKKVPLDPGAQEQAVRKAFEQWQNSLRDREYETAWRLLANGLRRSRQLDNDFQRFAKDWDSDENMMRTLFLDLRPGSVVSLKMGESAILNASHGGQPWRILYVVEDGQWKFHIMKRARQDGGDWQVRLLPKMRKRTAKHFDIFCFRGSTAEKEIDKIAEQRDRGFREICRFLGKDSDVRLRMILFEDAATKYSHTGHQGAGWAFGNTVVEIYNEKQKLNPYHETAHILMRAYGSPPALFNEGFATYIAERLGSHALAAMKGGESSIYDRVRELDGKGELIPLEELLTYTEIGSGESNPPVAYPEAASFVKFLIETYDKEKFLKAYRTLRNSSDKSVQQQNIEALQSIYGKSLDGLNKEWKAVLGGAIVNTGTTETRHWMPADPPKVLYKIDCSIDTEEGLLKGQEIISFANSTSQPIRTFALMGSVHGNEGLEIVGNGKPVTLSNKVYDNPIIFSLAEPVGPAESVVLDVKFSLSVPALWKSAEMAALVNWCPRIWYGFDAHGDYDVRVDVPDGYTVITSGLPDSKSGYYHAEDTKSFGMIITKTHDILQERAGDVLIRCLYRQKAKKCAELLLTTAVDAVTFYRQRFGFYPYQALTIVPGSDRPVGGYPMATGIVAIHGMERMDEKPKIHWQWIVAHEIGHQYWGEYVLEKDKPGWLWIGLGIYADREYCRARGLGLQKHKEVMARYIQGVRNGLDTTMNVSQEKLSGIGFDFNNVVIHGKGFSVVSALDCCLGKDDFDKIYRRCLNEFGGRRLGAHEFRAVCEEETSRDLGWFFKQWVNSNRYLSYDI
ncbi:MAG: M1 family aminopeptidase, partial [Planctomycetota bacterium]